MRWLLAIAVAVSLLVAGPTGARTDTPPDESDPALVKNYIHFPCDALEESYEFQYKRLVHLTGEILACHREAAEPNEYKYAKLMCMYVEMEWQLLYTHSVSIKKAWLLMCDVDGQRKNPQFEIDF